MVGLCCVGTNDKRALQPRATNPAPAAGAGDGITNASRHSRCAFSDTFRFALKMVSQSRKPPERKASNSRL
ncbi:hypothetical protein CGQ36_19520 [Nocardiopsis dassonvillei]|nr:hypothetical protein CGQ36_19520 [Nocardiopsis dassonvillei]